MCGISGGRLEGAIQQTVIENSLAAMRHRGPDEQGTYVDDPAFLANCRLSIIDLAGGHQPMFNEDRSVVVVLNGEIYNYLDLRRSLAEAGHRITSKSDTEVLVHCYEEYGPAMCEHLHGMFAFAVWDARKKLLLLARDHFGKKPLYYSITNRGIIFASELKSLKVLAQGTGERWSINENAVYDYLSFGSILQPDCIYQQVHALPPATWLTYDGNDLKTQEFWSLRYEPKATVSYVEAKEQTRELIGKAVSLRLQSDVPLGIFLSGGVDSSVVAYEASRILGGSLRTYTVAVSDPQFDESNRAALTARFLGTQHTVLRLDVSPLEELERIVRIYDQPFGDPSAIPTVAIARAAHEHVKVVLNGDGGDEFFGGYRRHVAARYSECFPRIPSLMANMMTRFLEIVGRLDERRSLLGFGNRLLRGARCGGGERYLVWTTDLLTDDDKRAVWLKNGRKATERRIETFLQGGLSALDTQMKTDIGLLLLSTLLVKMDMASMSASIEARSPLMDFRVAEYAARLPEAYKIRAGWTKAVLRDAYRDLLPDHVVRGRKYGFEVPLLSWLNTELRPVVMDVLGSPAANIRSYIDGSFLDNLLAGKVMKDRNWAHLIYALLMLEFWFREAADN